MPAWTRRLAYVGLLAGFCASCSTDTGVGDTTSGSATPEELTMAGSFSLTQANASALPVSFPKNSKACISTIQSGSLILKTSPNTFNLSVSVRSDCDTPIGQTPTPVLATLAENGTWTAVNGSFTPTYVSGSNVTLAAGTSTVSSVAVPSQVTFSEVQTVSATLIFGR